MTAQPRQNKFQRKHALEKLELELRHAQEWVDFFTEDGRLDMADLWQKELRRRQTNFTRLTQNDNTATA